MQREDIGARELSGDEVAMVDRCRRQHLRVPTISAVEFEARLPSERWAVVDVRPEWERRVSSIPGAFSLETFESCIDMYRTRRILVVCTAGCRSAVYAKRLRAQGLAAFSLYGGLLAWTAEGRVAIDAQGEATRQVAIPGEI